ncbi:hypothetical protein Bca52824_088685 [Brassica carinata]|uniref:Uncharacterized protein n=1 Tax=Brassica carinata TaxID=52824 RepID=A0A8X7PE41_BRACI|nr:hypothetical protein Bca52824_088685 [Brassica carinata]
MATFRPSLFFFFAFFLLFLTSATPLAVSSLVNPNPFKPPRIPYSDHCNHIVPESPPILLPPPPPAPPRSRSTSASSPAATPSSIGTTNRETPTSNPLALGPNRSAKL